eukprot:TRINITY_DN17561_c0_g1_i1.p1 TRINITY_DN17561_c0_g1~~TRINITY_DN17561_c0_g1_i1.p1  ORF type:complete len:427 (+),score=79.56 TRINITY_DN17561_c0_g1_i1:53-1333(+)
MNVYVITADGTRYSLSITIDTTVKELKEAACNEGDYEVSRTALEYAGKVLTDREKVSSYGVCGDDELYLQLERKFYAREELKKLGLTPTQTTFIKCISEGKAFALRYLYDAGCDPLALDECGDAAIHVAAKTGSTECLKVLIELSAGCLNLEGLDGNTPLCYAAQSSEECVELLLAAGADPSARSLTRSTPLHIAIRSGNIEIAELLLQQDGVQVDATDYSSSTPLHLSSYTDNVRATILLILHSCTIDARNNQGQTPLHTALSVDVAAKLIESKADVNARTDLGETPLHLAARQGNIDLSRLLIANGADPFILDKGNDSVLHEAATSGEHITEFILRHLSSIKDSRNLKGETPLYLAASRGFAGIVELLLQASADASIVSKKGLSPYSAAKANTHNPKAHALLEMHLRKVLLPDSVRQGSDAEVG